MAVATQVAVVADRLSGTAVAVDTRCLVVVATQVAVVADRLSGTAVAVDTRCLVVVAIVDYLVVGTTKRFPLNLV